MRARHPPFDETRSRVNTTTRLLRQASSGSIIGSQQINKKSEVCNFNDLATRPGTIRRVVVVSSSGDANNQQIR